MKPFFSVIIPTFNRERFIAKAIQSVLNQTFDDFEVIIIDDASTDNTQAVVKSFNESRIVYVQNKQNLERCVTRNKAIAIAKGEYICFLDSDDYHLPNHLEVLYSEITKRKNPISLFFTNAWDSDQTGELKERVCPYLLDYNVFHYIVTYTFNPQRMCIHREILQDFLFDPQVYVCEDLDLAIRIATKFPVIQIMERTTVYVFHNESFTGGDTRKPFKELENYRRIFKKPELRGKIPIISKFRILSMCYFHIAQLHQNNSKIWKMYQAISKSFLLFPPGYNGKTNKILLVMFIYNLPVVGKFFSRRK